MPKYLYPWVKVYVHLSDTLFPSSTIFPIEAGGLAEEPRLPDLGDFIFLHVESSVVSPP